MKLCEAHRSGICGHVSRVAGTIRSVAHRREIARDAVQRHAPASGVETCWQESSVRSCPSSQAARGREGPIRT